MNDQDTQRRQRQMADISLSRVDRRRQHTRALLLAAAYEEMRLVGVGDAKIKNITDRANVGFGTFYNYFDSKDDLARSVLDCVIHDLGNRNDFVTLSLKEREPLITIALSLRLTIRELITQPMWRWWALRPDLLATRTQLGFATYAQRDMVMAINAGLLQISEDDVLDCWRLSVWIMVGAIHDIIIGDADAKTEITATRSILRVMGASTPNATEAAMIDLPAYPEPKIDFTFDIDKVR